MLPADLDKNYNSPDEDTWSFDYNDVRAQPCPAGTMMCWNQAILHWGGRSSRHAQNPRISISLEFQRADVPPLNKPLLPNDSLPPFEVRMKRIALQILQYKHLYPLSPALRRSPWKWDSAARKPNSHYLYKDYFVNRERYC